MIILEAYRSFTGCFYIAVSQICWQTHCQISRVFFNVSCLSSGLLVLQRVKFPQFHVLLALLSSITLLSGNIGNNPGPVAATITRSNHQGDFRFEQSTGIQCICNALFSSWYSVVRKVQYWMKSDLVWLTFFITISGMLQSS